MIALESVVRPFTRKERSSSLQAPRLVWTGIRNFECDINVVTSLHNDLISRWIPSSIPVMKGWFEL